MCKLEDAPELMPCCMPYGCVYMIQCLVVHHVGDLVL
jgi:hypothetical protein